MELPHQKHESYRYKLPLKKNKLIGYLILGEKNFGASKKKILRKRTQKLKNTAFLQFMTTFHNVAFNRNQFQGKKVVKPTMKTRKVNDKR